MRLKKMVTTRPCEVKGCKNEAEFYVDMKGVLKTKFCFCEECLKKMFKGYLGTSVPKAVESPFKPLSKIKKERR